jgi:ParB-like chromosome segregation protein Spo0J
MSSPEQENTLLTHLRSEGLTEEEITAGRAAFPVGLSVHARSGTFPTAAEFRALIAKKDAPPAIRYDGGMNYHKAVRDLTEDEFAALRADIARDGRIYTPVLIDNYGNIVDGAHRAKIGRELGIDVPFQVVEASPAELAALAIRLNLHRRQLSAADRCRLVEQLAREGYAPKEIAEKIGASMPTVYRDLSELSNENSLPATRVSVNGRARPTQYAPRQPKPPEESPLTTATTSTTSSEKLRASATSPEDVQRICDAAAAARDPRDRLLAITKILEDFPSREQRRKFVAYLAETFR